jgi:tetratricopeptide (TPR) repeat protein
MGIVLGVKGDYDGAAMCFETCLALGEISGRQRADTLLAYGTMLKSKGDHPAANIKLGEAADAFDALKAPKRAEEARMEMKGI